MSDGNVESAPGGVSFEVLLDDKKTEKSPQPK